MQEAGGRHFAGNCAHPVEQIGLTGTARQGQSGVPPVADEREMDLLSEGGARGHHVLSGRLVGIADGCGYYAN